jgi:hypothetical protein
MAADEEIIGLKIQVDTNELDELTKILESELPDSIAASRKEIDKLNNLSIIDPTKAKQALKRIDQINDGINKTQSDIKKMDGNPIAGIFTNFNDLRDAIDGLDVGKIVESLGGLTDGVKTTSGGFDILKASIAATGLGLLVLLLVQIIENFDTLAASGGIVGTIFTAIGDAISYVKDLLTDLLVKFNIIGKTSENGEGAKKIAESSVELANETAKAAELAAAKLDETSKDYVAAVEKSSKLKLDADKKALELEKKEKLKGIRDKEVIAAIEATYALKSANLDTEAQNTIDEAKKKRDEKVKEQAKEASEKAKEQADKLRESTSSINSLRAELVASEISTIEVKDDNYVEAITKSTNVKLKADKDNAKSEFAEKIKEAGNNKKLIKSLKEEERLQLELLDKEANNIIIKATKDKKEFDKQITEQKISQSKTNTELELAQEQANIDKYKKNYFLYIQKSTEYYNNKFASDTKNLETDKANRLKGIKDQELILQIEEEFRLKQQDLLNNKNKSINDAKSTALDNILGTNTDDLDGKLQQQKLDDKLAQLRAYNAQIVNDESLTQQARQELSKKANDAITTIERTAQGQRRAEIGKTAASLATIGGLFKQNTIAYKATAIAQAGINTWLGVTEALSAKSILPSPYDVITKFANVGAIVASGLGAVANITGIGVDGGGSGGSAPTGPPPNSTGAIGTNYNNFSPGFAQNLGQPTDPTKNLQATKVYVTESDIANVSRRVQVLEGNASFA